MIFTKTRDVKSPSRGTPESAGLDFYVPNNVEPFWLIPGESTLIPSGIRMALKPGQVGIFQNKSSIGVKGLLVGACVIDSDYRGEVHLNIHNVSKDRAVEIKPGQKLTQLIITHVNLEEPVETTNESYKLCYDNTSRGSGGFGSTGQT